ncbi:hypothetical protein J3R30DRAFT_3511560 [Lentinula aciculospora]|uniref:Thaumatin-like protein n=1 Tax=Lentinula aciculospora TaxID=153920 RepID=A0A9W9A428_9AGAR|nr:hypothetical protein J3R30DRAFT_3511560 [Lentinula aciculospora]
MNMKHFISYLSTLLFISSTWAAPILLRRATGDHAFTLVNKCPNSITAHVEDTKCGYSPRCTDASSYTASQPGAIPAGGSTVVTIPANWVGRIFGQTDTSQCGAKGENCSVGEFNLDTGDTVTAQAYDISNIQDFTQAMSIQMQGCETVTCSSVDCSCSDAYPPGNEAGCGTEIDAPVRACGAGAIPATITFCP